MGHSTGDSDGHGEGWLRRHAVQLAGMLPPDPADARRVMALMREIHENFMVLPGEKDGSGGNVADFRRRKSR